MSKTYWIIFSCGCIDKGNERFAEIMMEMYTEKERMEINYDTFNIEVIFVEEPCIDCEEFIPFKNSHRPDETIQNRVYSHGVNAGFLRDCTIDRIKENIINIENFKNIEISTTLDTHIGNIGVNVSGEVVIASNIDLSSDYNAAGKRRFNLNTSAKNAVFTNIKDDQNNKYPEYIITNTNIKSVWVKEKFFEVEGAKELVQELSTKYQIEYVA